MTPVIPATTNGTELLKDSYVVKVANNGEKALKIAQSANPPDLILLDIMMPGLSGYDVCEQLKANPATENIPVIFLTAMTGTDDETKGFEMGRLISSPNLSNALPVVTLARVKYT